MAALAAAVASIGAGIAGYVSKKRSLAKVLGRQWGLYMGEVGWDCNSEDAVTPTPPPE